MAFGVKHSLTMTTVGTSSNATEYTPVIPYGNVNRIQFKLGTMSTTADIDVTTETSSIVIWTQANIIVDATVLPRQAIVTTTGGASTTQEPIMVVGERIKVAVTNAGAAKVGTVEIIVT